MDALPANDARVVRDCLLDFVRAKIHGKRLALELFPDTSLIRSGLFDSLDLAELASWVEREIAPDADLSSVDIAVAWDTVTDILDFIERHRSTPAHRA